MIRSAIGILVFLLLCVAPCTAAPRVALVVGNSDYQSVGKLANPANDARLVAETLQRLGFTLVGGAAQLDLDKPRFDQAIQAYSRQLLGAEVAVFYYAGHGIQVRGTNYLVPTSANPAREADVDFMMVDVGLVLRQMEAAGTKLNIVILDACRNNPFGGRGLRSSDGGLAQIRAPEGTILSYATQPGNVALDGDDGHSPYTRALVDAVQRPGLDVLQAFNQVGLTVKKATASAQQPWVASSPIDGTFYFAGPAAGQPTAPVAAAATPPPVPAPALASAPRSAEFVFPDSDQRLLSAADLQGRTKEELRIARNEIFARRGRHFSSPELTAYFSKFAWYVPRTWDPVLNPVEAANVDLLDRAENGATQPSGFLFADSDRRLLTPGELARLSKAELRLAKNEIFARRGRFFDAPDLKAYFGRFAWYAPSTWNPILNGVEEANVKLIDQMSKRP
ncbi:YARHG domain-containing protein [Bradyrhizobium sp. 83012]|uniref:YARHG domain-containing protein n=1 Tax=Bradyrhizobium aeschynomenes TaxID=2734909 RepID=A0ABX2CGF1_9BRAD|nr:YARHG domain-containing protein [Bradyrhizobium aeschynomenes]NPU67276.1 YARHG domain-containing protein [Bradyrhizobium aeschynomenes]